MADSNSVTYTVDVGYSAFGILDRCIICGAVMQFKSKTFSSHRIDVNIMCAHAKILERENLSAAVPVCVWVCCTSCCCFDFISASFNIHFVLCLYLYLSVLSLNRSWLKFGWAVCVCILFRFGIIICGICQCLTRWLSLCICSVCAPHKNTHWLS